MSLRCIIVFIVENLLSLTRLMWITLYHGHLSKMICCGISSYRALIVIDRKMINFRTRHSFIFYKNGIKKLWLRDKHQI